MHGVRFSYHGVAESGGESEEVVRLDQPFVEDVEAVAGWVTEQGLRPVLIGNCFGARTALAYAAGRSARAVAGLALVVPPVHDFEVARRLDRRPLSKLARRVSLPHVWAVVRSPARRRALGRTVRALRRVGRNRVRAGRRADPRVAEPWFWRQLADVVGRGIPVLVVYGEDDNYYRDFELARAGTLGDVVARAGTLVQIPSCRVGSTG